MSYENQAQTIVATSLTTQRIRSSYKTPTVECELYFGRRNPTGGFDSCGSDATPTSRLELYCSGGTPIGAAMIEPRVLVLQWERHNW